MIRLSASLLKDYIVCPRQAYYRINNSGEGLQTLAMSIGSTAHSILEKYPFDKDGAFGAIDSTLERFVGKTTPSLKIQIEKYLNVYFDKFIHMVSEDDEIEKFFRVRFDNVEPVIVGKFDVVHNNDVIDWKTSKKLYNKMERDIQFIIYYLAYQKEYKRYPTNVFYASLHSGELHRFEPNLEIIKHFMEEVIPYAVQGLLSGYAPRYGLFNYSGYLCSKCTWRNLCLPECELN